MGEVKNHKDEQRRRASVAAVAAARRIAGATITPSTPVGDLSDAEWGWIITTAIFAWVAAHAEESAKSGADTELAVRAMGNLRPWDAGAITMILPGLADTPDLQWAKPITDWTRDEMVRFLSTALDLARKAILARDVGGLSIVRKPTAEELKDTIPF